MKTDSPRDTPGHETRDVSLRPILWFGLALLVIGVVIQGLVALLLIGFAEQYRRSQPPVPSLAKDRPRFPENLSRIPPPRLQVSEYEDLKRFRHERMHELNSYGWNGKTKTVRIPIDRAIDLLANPETAGNIAIPIEKEQR